MGLFATLLQRTHKDPQADLRDLVGDYELPTFPAAVMNALGMLRDPDCALASVADELQMDPGMNVRVLRMVNSAAFALQNKVSNLHHAVTLLGRSRLESLVLSCVVSASLPRGDICRGLDLQRFWLVGARRACLARHLGRHLHPTSEAESFTCALLQDIAVPVLARARPEVYPALCEAALADPVPGLAEREHQALGFDHAVVGALMAETWGLPAELCAAVHDHHASDAGAAAQPAVRLAALIDYGIEQDGRAEVIARGREEYGIEAERLEQMLARSDHEAAHISTLLA